MDFDDDLRVMLLGFVVAFGILGVLFWYVGFDDITAALAPAQPIFILAIIGIAFIWLLSWGLALRIVLRVLGISISVPTAFLVFTAAQFSNNVTPFGQAGGEPFSALLISRATNTRYENGLAAIASIDALNFVPSIIFAFLGVGYFAARFTLGPRLSTVTIVLVALVLIIGSIAGAVWLFRHRLVPVTSRIITPFVRFVGRVLPRLSPPPRNLVHNRIKEFFSAINRVASDRNSLVLALVFSALGWLSITISLWLSLQALGYLVPFPILLIVIPMGAIAGITPLPGGLGGTEAVIILLLVPITAVSPAIASAAVVIHRTATYWLPVFIGAASSVIISTKARRTRIEP